ncbi:MAG: class I SAM-dependent methyltransferase [Hyphomicrobiales bacterium]|nr:class I SAM-dependent methyltransferase [Hyphomicrobiales bacterium]
MNGADLFTFLQDADFYRDMHETAARQLPPGDGRTWLDVGCGPGVLARIAAARGYSVRGIDCSEAMIGAAKRLAAERRVTVEFEVSDLKREFDRGRRYDVVSASSLLVVLPSPKAGLAQLMELVKPSGIVLVIEATERMSRLRALRMIATQRLGSRSYMLLAWSMGRSGRALPDTMFPEEPGSLPAVKLLDGLATARIMRGRP